ncbi:MAG: hypothetical protein LAT82_00125 [Nanoarchaeota archaeon]|nr:hypothetical protein [Nanoarchaeota archaeon]
MYSISIKEELDKKFKKLSKKNKKQLNIIFKKIEEICENPQHFKNLRKPLQHLKRVHIDTHFVLTFSVDENKKEITFEDFDHHDIIYKN